MWSQQSELTSLDLPLGSTETVAVVPLNGNGVPLAGALETMWQTSDASVVTVGPVGTSETTGDNEINEDEVTLTAQAAGSATITVTQGDVTTELAITVPPEEMTP